MKLSKELYFPTPIYFVDLDDADSLNLYLKTRINSWRDQDQEGITRSNVSQVGSWHSATVLNKRPEYKAFVDIVDNQLSQVYADQQFSPKHIPTCHNMWANINPRGAYNRSHVHPGSLWSGVYYVQTPADCGRIIFQDPRGQASILLAHQNDDLQPGPEQWTEVFHKPVAGRLIMFPSWLRHEVEPNLSSLTGPNSDRISISFNYGQERA